MPQVTPAKVFYSAALRQVSLPAGILDPILQALSRLPTLKDVGIMKHPRNRLQGFNLNVIHGDIARFASLGFWNVFAGCQCQSTSSLAAYSPSSLYGEQQRPENDTQTA